MTVLLQAVDLVENSELPWGGVLEFIHQSHRVLCADTVAQGLARFRSRRTERCMQAVEQVGKAKPALLLLQPLHAGRERSRRVPTYLGVQRGNSIHGCQQFIQLCAFRGQRNRRHLVVAHRLQKCSSKPAQVRVLRWATDAACRDPRLQFSKPFQQVTAGKLGTVERVRLGFHHARYPSPQPLHTLRPALDELLPFFKESVEPFT